MSEHPDSQLDDIDSLIVASFKGAAIEDADPIGRIGQALSDIRALDLDQWPTGDLLAFHRVLRRVAQDVHKAIITDKPQRS